MRGFFRGKFQRRLRVFGGFSADGFRHEPYFSWCYPQISKMCFVVHIFYFLACVAAAADFVFSASAACISSSFCILPPCLLNLRVGENSPNLCPTISSLTRTGIKSFPLWTPKVNPTISGEIVDLRDQVFITAKEPGFKPVSFFNSLSSIYGPFFKLLGMKIVYS